MEEMPIYCCEIFGRTGSSRSNGQTSWKDHCHSHVYCCTAAVGARCDCGRLCPKSNSGQIHSWARQRQRQTAPGQSARNGILGDHCGQHHRVCHCHGHQRPAQHPLHQSLPWQSHSKLTCSLSLSFSIRHVFGWAEPGLCVCNVK